MIRFGKEGWNKKGKRLEEGEDGPSWEIKSSVLFCSLFVSCYQMSKLVFQVVSSYRIVIAIKDGFLSKDAIKDGFLSKEWISNYRQAVD
jgi:hypothetical protein